MSVCPHLQGGRYPSQGGAQGHLPRVHPPSQVRMGGPQPGGAPTWGTPQSGQDGGYPSQGAPAWVLPQYRTSHGVLDKRRSVCLLRSRRRTVLFIYSFLFKCVEVFNIASLQIVIFIHALKKFLQTKYFNFL